MNTVLIRILKTVLLTYIYFQKIRCFGHRRVGNLMVSIFMGIITFG